MLLIGIILPLLMLPGVKIIKATFFLSFLAYGAQVVGVLLGVFGAVFYTDYTRKKKKHEKSDHERKEYDYSDYD